LATSVAFVLMLPALWVGFVADDYFHRIVLLRLGGWTEAVAVRDLYAFIPKGASGWKLDLGAAWWTDSSMHIRFGRPLTALTHALDYRLWPDAPGLHHLQSLLWFALGVGLTATLYRRVHASAAVAGMAALLFAVQGSHSVVAAWLANRSTLLCLAFGVAALIEHLAWRRTGERRHLAFALILLALGLAGGEAAVAAAAYVLAWQVTCEEGTWTRRLLPVLPYAALVMVWRFLYGRLGFGATGATMYLDPSDQPLLFLGATVERLPILLTGALLQAPVDLWLLLSRRGQIAAAALATGLVAGLLSALWNLLRRDPIARFWALGMALSLLPFCTTFPQSRLLGFAGIGAAGLLAAFFEASGVWPWEPAPGDRRSRLALLLLLLHGPLAAILTPIRIGALPIFADLTTAPSRRAPRGPEVTQQTFVFLNGSDFLLAYLHIMRTAQGGAPLPRRMALLSPLSTPSRVERTDARTLVIASEPGWFHYVIDRAFVSPSRRFSAGERIERPDYVAEIRSTTDDGRPLEVAFRFHVPLESPELRWLYWKNDRLIPFPLPAIGTGVSVPRGIYP